MFGELEYEHGVCMCGCIYRMCEGFKFECLLLMTDGCDSVTILQAPVDTSCVLPLIKALCSIHLTPAAVLHHSAQKKITKTSVFILDVAVIMA